MGRRATWRTPLPDGKLVGYGFKVRGGIFRVQFRHPTNPTKYMELSTGVEVPRNWTPERDPPPDAFTQAAKLIAEHHLPAADAHPIRATWDEAIAHLGATPDLRPDSIRGYLTAVRAVRAVLDTRGPVDVTVELAHRWKRAFLSGRYVRGKASDAATYPRSPTSCTTNLRSLRSLWSKHWKPAGFVRSNPWLEVPYPNAPRGRRVRLPPEDAVAELLGWLDRRYPDWEMPRAFVETKLVAGCRTLDLCKAKSADLDGDVLTLSAEVTKTRTPRTVPLPPGLAEKLHRLKGPVWLWERSAAESKAHRPATRTHDRTEYNPSSWRWTIQNLFREFNAGRPKKDQVRPHDLRARAITLVAAATQSVDATAESLGVDPQTARHYLDRAKAFNGTDVMKRMAAALLPPQSPA
jgi:hypothetical protein